LRKRWTYNETSPDNAASFLLVSREIVRVAELGQPERRLIAEDPGDRFTEVERAYTRLIGTGVALLPPGDDTQAHTWERDPSLSLQECTAGLHLFLDHLISLDDEELRATSRGMSRALAEQLFIPEWDLYEPAFYQRMFGSLPALRPGLPAVD
jgi:hypothetical protein